MMKISILISDPNHPVVNSLKGWREMMNEKGHSVQIHFEKKDLLGGDFLFLVSCSHIIKKSERDLFKYVLVLHASDLPASRGWSPHIWAILSGESEITVSLIEADDPVDTGRIWLKEKFYLNGDELLNEINEKLFRTELELMTKAVEQHNFIEPQPQIGNPGEYLHRRTPSDSQLDPNASISDQFNLLRVVDNERYPAFLEYRGHRYIIKIEKYNHE